MHRMSFNKEESCLNPCYTGMEIEHDSCHNDIYSLFVLILVILEWR